MNLRGMESRADKLAENAWLRLLGRATMVASGPVVAVALTWLGNALWELNRGQVELSTRVSILTERVDALAVDQYQGVDAARDFKLRDQKDSHQDWRLDRHDRAIERLQEPDG